MSDRSMSLRNQRPSPARLARRRSRAGGTVVETALAINVLLLLLLGIIDYGKLVMTKQLIDNAAREGARQATTGTNTLTTSTIQSTVTQFLGGQGLSSMSIQVYQVNPLTGANLGSWNSTPLGGSIAVTISGNYIPLLPAFSRIPNPLPLTTTAMMTSEAN
jgi:Flp pilus assembly protein TadG